MPTLDGDLANHQGRHEEAYEHLRKAVELDDNLSYTEPRGLDAPAAASVGGTASRPGHREEAEQVYRDDLGLTTSVQRCAQHHDSVWALHGLVEFLKARSDTIELPKFESKLKVALAKTDVAVTSSCLCSIKTQATGSCRD